MLKERKSSSLSYHFRYPRQLRFIYYKERKSLIISSSKVADGNISHLLWKYLTSFIAKLSYNPHYCGYYYEDEASICVELQILTIKIEKTNYRNFVEDRLLYSFKICKEEMINKTVSCRLIYSEYTEVIRID